MQGYEGPECYCIKPDDDGKPAAWCLILDNYAAGAGYKPFVTDNLGGGQFKPGEGFVFPFKFRHGCALPVSDEEYKRLEAAYAKAKP
jgi:hypothetical protein